MTSPRPRGDLAAAAGTPASLPDAAALRLVVRGVIACVLRERADHPDVEDCTHEALRRAIEGAARVREGEPLRPWVLGIARHVAIDALRARKRARRVQPVSEAADGADVPSPIERVADPAPAPDERVARAQQTRRVLGAMDRLSDGQRSALRMFHEEGLGYQEIAARLGVPLGTVATWLARGRRAIADALGEEADA